MTILRNSVLHYSELLISQFGNWELRKLYRIHTVLREVVIEWGVSSYDRCMHSGRGWKSARQGVFGLAMMVGRGVPGRCAAWRIV